MKTAPRFLVDENGEKVAVVLPVAEYEKLLEELEELEDIRAFDESKTSKEELIPLEQAIAEIEKRSK